ncbi:MAG: redoxin domain-containing protein [Abitibacteriaceae bacterium]|nr:redoxin domain-containing protein [Abditibacteriaceae bacterium]MBV9867221.1 redoxin domain-containing protein [Abditibacteriaceae bacterium]
MIPLLLLASGVSAHAETLVVKDINGASHNLLSQKAKATVLIFIAHDCPISNGYAPEINRLCAAYAPQQVTFYVVYAEPDLTLAQAKTHAKDYGYKCAALLDTGLRLAKRTQVEVTPEVAVLSPQGKVWYRGRIDNRYAGYGKMRLQPTQRDLQAALEAVVKGKLIAHPITKAIGCFIPTSH